MIQRDSSTLYLSTGLHCIDEPTLDSFIFYCLNAEKLNKVPSSTPFTYKALILVFIPETGSVEFERFTALLGDKVRLKGWDKYRGGLDVKGKF
jgi:hypothetical protein